MSRSPHQISSFLSFIILLICLAGVGVIFYDIPYVEISDLVFEQFRIPSTETLLIGGLSSVGVLSIYFILQSTFHMIPPKHSLWFRIYRRFRTWFPYSLVTWLYQHPILGVLFGSLAASILVERFSTNLIVPVTAFYASTLFLQQVFSKHHTKLIIKPGHGTPDSVPDHIHHIDSTEARVLTIDVSNDEERVANLNIKYQIFDEFGYPITGWRIANPSEFERKQIGMGESCNDIGLYLWEISEEEPDKYISLVKASDRRLGRLFSTYSISSHSSKD